MICGPSWAAWRALRGTTGMGKSGTFRAFFEHAYTGVLGQPRRPAKAASRGQEMSGVAVGSLVTKRDRRQHVVQLRGGSGPLFQSGSRSIGVQSARPFNLYDPRNARSSCINLFGCLRIARSSACDGRQEQRGASKIAVEGKRVPGRGIDNHTSFSGKSCVFPREICVGRSPGWNTDRVATFRRELRRLGSRRTSETAGTRSVPKGGSHAGAWEPVDHRSCPFSGSTLIQRYWI